MSTVPAAEATTSTAAGATTSTAAAAPATSSPAGAPATVVPAAQPGADPSPSAATAAEPDTVDAFSHGWFSDDAAFLQVALWGLLLTLAAVSAYLVSRTARRNWAGALVGIVPFVMALYFFFQNVNRLLPAAL
ncbi:MAG: hypothetical protein H0W46_11700 [Acidimicrobiia bacterium]|nr:hypothetical protein [Acidimicrobiia bacterium]